MELQRLKDLAVAARVGFNADRRDWEKFMAMGQSGAGFQPAVDSGNDGQRLMERMARRGYRRTLADL